MFNFNFQHTKCCSYNFPLSNVIIVNPTLYNCTFLCWTFVQFGLVLISKRAGFVRTQELFSAQGKIYIELDNVFNRFSLVICTYFVISFFCIKYVCVGRQLSISMFFGPQGATHTSSALPMWQIWKLSPTDYSSLKLLWSLPRCHMHTFASLN